MVVTQGPKHVASHTIKCFIILILNLNTWCLQSN